MQHKVSETAEAINTASIQKYLCQHKRLNPLVVSKFKLIRKEAVDALQQAVNLKYEDLGWLFMFILYFCVPNYTFELNVCLSVCEKTFYKKSITYKEFKKQHMKLPKNEVLVSCSCQLLLSIEK
jgi:hypothetical protein